MATERPSFPGTISADAKNPRSGSAKPIPCPAGMPLRLIPYDARNPSTQDGLRAIEGSLGAALVGFFRFPSAFHRGIDPNRTGPRSNCCASASAKPSACRRLRMASKADRIFGASSACLLAGPGRVRSQGLGRQRSDTQTPTAHGGCGGRAPATQDKVGVFRPGLRRLCSRPATGKEGWKPNRTEVLPAN